MFDIPFDKIFESSENPQSIEFGKRIKLKSGKLGTENGSLTDFKGKLFISLNNHLNQVKLDCPNGKCTYNQTHKTYTLSNLPTYFMVNLQNKNIFNNSALDVLKSLILIPGLFDISTIFEYRNEKYIYILHAGKSYFMSSLEEFVIIIVNLSLHSSFNKMNGYIMTMIKSFIIKIGMN